VSSPAGAPRNPPLAHDTGKAFFRRFKRFFLTGWSETTQTDVRGDTRILKRIRWGFMAPANATRWIWQTVLAVVLLLSVAGAADARPKIFVDGFFTQAKEKAKKENKLLVIDFVSDPCPPCAFMDKTTWVDPAVEKWMEENAVAM